MQRLFLDYPYLWSSLGYLLTAALFYAVWPAGRRLLLAAGLLNLPFTLGALLHVPEYWNPRVTCSCLIAPEDLLFMFAVSMECVFLAAWPVRRRLSWIPHPRRSLLRFSALAAGGAGLVLLLDYAYGLRDIMLITLTGYAAVALAILLVCRELWPLAVNGMLGYTTLYFLQVLLVLHIWPQFTAQWTPGAQLRWAPWGIPGYELWWAAGFGLAWPLFAAYVLGVGLAPVKIQASANGL